MSKQPEQELAKDWIAKPVTKLDENVLHVSQREYAVIDHDSRRGISYIASDSATTCHILILIHPETKVIGLAHFDGCNTSQGVAELLQLMDTFVSRRDNGSAVSHITPSRLDVYLFGGFIDGKGTSDELSKELLGALHSCPHQLNIRVLCVGELNSRYRGRVCYPVYYGAGVNCETLEVCRVECKNRGPLPNVKGCRNFVGPKQMKNCYDNTTGEMLIEPFDYRPIDQVELWLQQSDEFLLKYLSTSPQQEPEHFVSSVKESLLCMEQHPHPMKTLFKDNKAFRFRLAGGYWEPVTLSK